MMKTEATKSIAGILVNRLLEQSDTDDFDPEEAKSFALDAYDNAIKNQPPEIAGVLENAPEYFVDAFLRKEDAEWETYPVDNDWWPIPCDNDVWNKVSYYSDYRTEGGRLIQLFNEVDSDGDHNFVDEAEIGTPEWINLRDQFAYYKWLEANADYSEWVAEHGEDPLSFFNVKATQRVSSVWLFGFVQDGERARFWKARKSGEQPVNDLNQLPQEAKDYINVDDNGINQDVTWQEIQAMAQGNADDRPIIKQSRDGTVYAEFKVDLTGVHPNVRYKQELKQVAAEEAKRERTEAKKAKRSHKKIPHCVA